MKKTISVVVALAMVLVMTFTSFAAVTMTTPKPTAPNDVEGWTAYYTELFGYAETDADEVVDILFETINSGEIDQETAMQAIVPAMAGMTDEGRQMFIEALRKAAEEQGIELPPLPGENPDLPELPSDFEPSFTLPDFGSGDESFLDTILGALGGLGDILFGGGDDTEDPTTPDDDDDDLWGDDTEDPEIPDMGDTSVVAVGAVAAVAVAALVLTRKKSKNDDAE